MDFSFPIVALSFSFFLLSIISITVTPTQSLSTPPTNLVTSRRQLFLQSLSLLTLVQPAACAWSDSTSTDTDDSARNTLLACQNGALVTESAVPGAYQSICMLEKERSIPFSSSPSPNTSKSNSKSDNNIIIQQGQSVGAGRTGVAVWNSCLLLTRLLQQLDSDDYIKDRVVLELGCGTGLASIVCSKLGAARVIATDGNPEVVELARQNVELNHASVETATLPWGMLDAMEYPDTADLIIGSDLTYNSGTWRVLTETISTVLKPGGRFLYLSLGHSGFNVKGELDGFLQVIQNEGLVVEPSSTNALQQQLQSVVSSSKEEQSVLVATGGVRVLVLRKPEVKRAYSTR